MEYHHYQQHEENNTTATNNNNTSVNVGNVESKSSFLCRQSSTRWIPTGEQVRILRDLYYNCGVRSPSAEQIQKISARLRQYGKIEGKNVFYWFQNHKARERQKRRLTVDAPNPTNKNVASGPCPSPGFYGVGPMGSSGCGDSPVLMERSIGEPWMSGGAGGMGFDHPALWVYDHYAAVEQETTAVTANREIETLPLFPIQENQEDQENGCSYQHHPESASWNPYHDGDHRAASLELSLSSYYYAPPGSA